MIDAFFNVFRRLFRDRVAITFLLVSPILYALIYPNAYTGQLASNIPVAIVDMDNSALSRTISQQVGATQQARLVATIQSPDLALDMMYDRKIHAFILIPEDYSESIMDGDPGDIVIYGNGAYLLRTSSAINAISGSLRKAGIETIIEQSSVLGAPAAQPLQVIEHPLFNTREGYGSFIVPGVVFIIIHQTLLIGLTTLAATIREDRGKRFSTTPFRFLGVAAAFVTIACATSTFFVGYIFWFNDYPRAEADPFALMVAILVFAMGTAAGALLLASFFKTRERPIQLWVTTSIPIFFLSGLSWPPEATPSWLVWFSKLFPTTPGIRMMSSLNQMGASLPDVQADLINLLLLTLIYGGIAAYRFTRTSEPFPEPLAKTV